MRVTLPEQRTGESILNAYFGLSEPKTKFQLCGLLGRRENSKNHW